jgi:hypothetical protein
MPDPHQAAAVARHQQQVNAHNEAVRNASKNGPPETTMQDVEAARRHYVLAIDNLLELLDPQSLRYRQNLTHVDAMQLSHRRIVDVRGNQLEEVRSRYEAQERQKAREADVALAVSNNEAAIKQATLAEKQALAADAQVTIARSAKHAAWAAAFVAAASVGTTLMQWLAPRR